MIRNIIFDIGNVLTDFRWKLFLEEKGYDEKEVERISKATILSPHWQEVDRGVWSEEKILDAFAANDREMESEIRRAFSDFHDLVSLRDYAIPWIKDLREKGFRVFYLSNFSKKAEAECRPALSFIPHTDGGILSYNEKMIKPDPEIYRLLLTRFGLSPEESVFLDDTRRNIDAACDLGIHGIWFQNKEQAMADLEKLLA